ncbi:LuxR C-terminal-related transcriptional regulator [Isobaculum melis]|uniref:LuxR family transcriptional regulator, maltose regulon positive regulatory protein n=1 Tax=Isobaculum melis TaxID=142588 RepID=A0A1H9UC09_9LACT|nr:LuxR C-terminal-related transcriptional regulator [Isobaculum melis]SES06889.1 LuxR family transcriptional regulator, maltose regulon positive regulatory protein [Isobaculum melis]
MEKRILNGRIRQPEVRKKIVRRPLLMNKIYGITTKKLLVVEAGAGRGKTTAVTAFLSDYPKEQIKWVSLGKDCNHLYVFWSYLVEVLQTQLGELKQEFLAFFQATVNKETIDDGIAFLSNGLFESEDFFLVLDDFHLIENEEVLQSFALFLSQMPATVHVLLLTRHRPKLYLGNLEMDDQLQYIVEKDFFLSENEALKFVEEAVGAALTQEEKQQFITIADGWIGGLQLLIAANLRTGIIKLNELEKSDKVLSDYLSKEIFQQLTTEEQTFLVQTASFSYLNEALSHALLPQIDFQECIMQLMHKNLLIECVDLNHQIYQYHPILKDFLMLQFEKKALAEQKQLKAVAASSFIQQGDLDEGIRLLLEIEDYAQMMALIIDLPQTIRSAYYVGEVPIPEAIQNIDFAYQKIFYHYSNLEYAVCQEIIDALEKKYPEKNEIKAIAGIKILLGIQPFSIEQLSITVAEIKQLQLTPTSKAFILLKNAAVLYFRDQFVEAIDLVKSSMALNQQTNNSFLTYFNQNLLAQLYEETGELNQSLALLKATKKMIAKMKYGQSIKKNYELTFYMTISGIYLKRLDLENAEKTLLKVSQQQHEHVALAYQYNQAEFFYLSNRPEEAFQVVQKIEDEALGHYSVLTKSILLKYCLKYNQLSKAFQDSYVTLYHQEKNNHSLNNQLFYSMILVKQAQPEQAIEVIDQILIKSRKNQIFLKIIEANLLKLSILLAQPNADQRLLKNLYSESLYYASDNEIKAPFYFYQEVVCQLDTQFSQELAAQLEPKEQAFHQQLLAVCDVADKDLLTAREHEVLIEIAKGATNRQMAEKLFISEATIKTHILNIYRKLEVNSRVTVVAKAKEMGLL